MDKLLYVPLGAALIRTPVLPSEYGFSRQTLPDYLERLLDCAIAVGSSSLHDARTSTISEAGVKAKVDRYRRRMCSRPTPYGLFAGVCLATFSDKTTFCRDRDIATSTRPDMSWALRLIFKLESTKHVRRLLRYHANPELLVKANRIWLALPPAATDKSSAPTSLRATPPVMRVLALCSKGILFEDLIETIAREFCTPIHKVEALCNELCDYSIILSELRFSLGTKDPLSFILGQVERFDEELLLAPQLRSLSDALNRWDSCKSKTADEFLRLTSAAKNIELSETNCYLQVDTEVKTIGAEFSFLVGQQMGLAAEILLNSTPINESGYLRAYRTTFLNRYQQGREIPVLELLDETFGLGSPYLVAASSNQTGVDPHYDQRLFEIANEALQSRTRVVRFTEREFRSVQHRRLYPQQLPLSLDLFVCLAATSREEIDKGNFKIIVSPRVGEVGGGRALGRFAHMLGDTALLNLSLIADAERRFDVNSVSADLSYYPVQPRSINVAIAPQIRSYGTCQ